MQGSENRFLFYLTDRFVGAILSGQCLVIVQKGGFMAKWFFLSLSLSFSAVLAGNTLFQVIDSYHRIWVDFQPYLSRYDQSGPDSPAEMELKEQLKGLYRRCMTGAILERYEDFLDRTTFHCGAASSFYPIAPTKVLSRRVVSNDGSAAVVEYSVQSTEIWSSMEDFSITSRDDRQLRDIYERYQVSSPPFLALKSRLVSCYKMFSVGGRQQKMPCDYELTIKGQSTLTFNLESVDGQWRVSLVDESFRSSTISVKMY